jgi:pimeloyl-ACP methyl ester carboxylesterase
LALIREMLMRQDAEGYARTCEALADAEAPDVAPIKCPVLLLTGDEDPIATPTGMRAVGARIAGSRTHVVGKCGHWATFEKPKETRSALEEFLLRRH